jgi:hypothetical protein
MGMLEVDQAKQLKELQRENARLKRMLADEMLGKELLKETLEKKLRAPDISVRLLKSLSPGDVARVVRPAVILGCTAALSPTKRSNRMHGWLGSRQPCDASPISIPRWDIPK